VQELHLVENYCSNENFRVHVNMLSLNYIPLPDVIVVFEKLSKNSPPEQDPIIDYWEDNYFGRLRRNRRENPSSLCQYGMYIIESLKIFQGPIILWNVGTVHSNKQLTAIIYQFIN